MSDYLDANNEELLKDFFSEAEQQVENLESNILVIENDPANHEAIDEIFRAAHTLKGGSATVEMNELSGFTHIVEDLLDALRSGILAVNESVVDVLLSAIDVIKAMLESRAQGSIYQEDVEPLKEKLRSFIPEKTDKKKKAPASAPRPSAPAAPPPPVQNAQPAASSAGAVQIAPPASLMSEYEILELKQACPAGQELWGVTVLFDESNLMNSVGGIQVFAALKEKGSVLKTIPDFDVLYEDEFQPQVVYYIASSASADELEDASFLTDVTLCSDAQRVDVSEQDTPAQPAASAAKTEPVPAAQPESSAAPETPAAVPAQKTDKPAESAAAQNKGAKPAEPAKKSAGTGHAAAGSVLRVDSKRIDYLLNLVSETVITKAAFNQCVLQINDLQTQLQNSETSYKEKVRRLFEQIPSYLEQIQNGAVMKDIKTQINTEFGDIYSAFDNFDAAFKNVTAKFRSSTQNLGRIAGELQEGVMKIRMVPISQIFSRFPRVVRDLSRDLDKKINLVIEGEDTELDKSVVEDLLDPIMHCVRNSVDHGIESAANRLAAGKQEEGTLLLKASNEGNMIVIDIVDDGKGIDVAKVRQKAIDRELIHPSKIISDQEAFQLIFHAGFSTADKITNVSGRGVGLDVVKTQIDKLNGTVTVSSEQGKGTKFSIRLPLTLAIIQGLLVRVGTEVYSIPIASVIESHRVKADEINTIDNYEVLNVRNEVISVLRLSRLFGIKNVESSEYNFIVIVGTTDKKIGVMVDALIGEEDVVIKPLRDQFTNSPGIAGASILGDGSVSLIIDVTQLLELGVKQELTERQERAALFTEEV
ncbi:MAG: chemotaxis protein CheA [Bacteroides sp.]|nr:chemotaxis protein CheA [Prevotella sp.]MCM1408773.1 chemotaxis protein CheA [Treponema brennaborense]MCM1470688.1 chemotaxis protein CheA [Bacteroides sp.]